MEEISINSKYWSPFKRNLKIDTTNNWGLQLKSRSGILTRTRMYIDKSKGDDWPFFLSINHLMDRLNQTICCLADIFPGNVKCSSDN